MALIIKLILSESTVGRGVASDPVRRVVELWTMNGTLVASHDTWLKAADGESMSFFNSFRIPMYTDNDH